MSDENANSGGTPGANGASGADGAPQAAAQPGLRILAHFIRDLSFENIAAQQGTKAEGAPEINVNVNLDAGGAGENRYQLAMKVNATAKSGDATRFIVELDYVGLFEVTNVPQEHIHPFLFIECPRQILPYARRVISDVTRDGGYPPLMLDNIDFAALYRQRLEQLRAQQGEAAES
ncbi:MAG TPA: protein-export chaperone SecB [Paracoccaceae bacterium]|nr:protein-export chaperone SecB [Paracoccaceae bacterium]